MYIISKAHHQIFHSKYVQNTYLFSILAKKGFPNWYTPEYYGRL